MFSYIKKISAAYLDKELEIVIFEIQKLSLPKNFSQYVLYILSELFNNITEHSFAKNVRFEIIIKNRHFKMMV
jgi:nitrate/nitrite-specific signal transduction histidine kinase